MTASPANLILKILSIFRLLLICYSVELRLKGMIRNKRLSKSIADVAWSELIRQLEYKSLWKRKTILKIDK